MSKPRKPDPERPDEDNPEWTREDMAKARPAAEVLPALIGEKATQELLRRSRGRPPKDKKSRPPKGTARVDRGKIRFCACPSPFPGRGGSAGRCGFSRRWTRRSRGTPAGYG